MLINSSKVILIKVMMWDRKLEESEIRNIYKRPVRDGLKLFYDFNLGKH